jgi:hypothetical protein
MNPLNTPPGFHDPSQGMVAKDGFDELADGNLKARIQAEISFIDQFDRRSIFYSLVFIGVIHRFLFIPGLE